MLDSGPSALCAVAKSDGPVEETTRRGLIQKPSVGNHTSKSCFDGSSASDFARHLRTSYPELVSAGHVLTPQF